LVVGPNGAGEVNIGTGGVLTTNVNTNVFSIGTGNSEGAEIRGGTLALQVFGTSTTAGTRTFNVNDGATGADLKITSAIVDGTGLQSVGIIKTGFGSLELGGTTANTYTGSTTVSEGTLLLNKGTGTGGVSAMQGPLFIGDNLAEFGLAKSDVVRWMQSHQLPNFLAPVEIRTTGWMDLNGWDETIGNVDAQTALTMQAASAITTGVGTLTVNGNIVGSAATGANMWTVFAAPVIDGKLHLGDVVRSIDIVDQVGVVSDFVITADISGSGGIRKTNTGVLLLSGNSTYSGDTFLTDGYLSAGRNTAFGTSRVYFPAAATANTFTGLFAHGVPGS